jgi:Arylsulfatase regulator (Fe-S oxidoreductase)
MLEPKNGLHVTSLDNEQWQDYFSKLIMSSNEQPAEGCTLDPDLKVKNITFVVTERCNLACTYCYETHKTGAVMTREIAKDAVDFLFDKEKVNDYFSEERSPGVILEFIGGEPLLEIDLMDFIVEYFKFKAFEAGSPWATNYMISMTSNGILFDTPKVEQFIKRNPNRVSIGITIDGNKELHDACRVFPDGSGSYDTVVKSVKKWIELDSQPSTKLTLSPDNVSYLFEATLNLWNLGIPIVFSNCVFEEGWKPEHAKIFYDQLIKLADYMLENESYKHNFISLFDETIGKPLTEDRNWCGGNGSMLAIAPDGRCFPCIRFMKYSLSEPGRKEQPIGDIWRGLDAKGENVWLNKLCQITMSSQSTDKCNKCQIASGCALCTGYNYDKFGDPNHRATFICDMHHARVKANIYYWSKLYKKLGLDRTFQNNIPKDWLII